MANTYKNIVITPNIGNTSDPKIQFSGGNTTANTDINLVVYPNSNGTLSFEGSAGQLFSITNDLSNSLFAVSDVSGIPSLEVFANGLVSAIPFGGNVVFGNSSVSVLVNSSAVIGNTIGVHTGNVSATTLSGNLTGNVVATTITGNLTGNVAATTISGNLTGNVAATTITGNLTGNVIATTINVASSILANASGFFPASNTVGSTFGNTTARWVVSANTIDASGNVVINGNVAINTTIQTDTSMYMSDFWATDTSTYGIYVYGQDQNTSLTAIRSRYGLYGYLTNRSQNKNADGITTYNSNYRAVVGDALNGSSSSGGNAFASEIIGGNFRSYQYANGTAANTINNAVGSRNQVWQLGSGVITGAYGTQSQVSIGNTTVTGNITSAYGVYSSVTSNTGGTIGNGYLFYGEHLGATTTTKWGAYVTGETKNYFSGNTGIGNTSPTDKFSVNGTTYLGANLTLISTAALIANGSAGTAGHVLHSNGTAVYWATDDQGVTSVASGNGLTGGTITSTGTLSVVAGTGTVVNATGVHVNATYIGTLSSNNATYLNGQLASYYTNATNITTGTLPVAQINTTAQYDWTNTHSISVAGNQLLLHEPGNTATLVQRNSAGFYYFLVSANSSSPSGSYNTLRPLYINLNTGLVAMANGATISNSLNLGTSILYANGSAGTAGHVLHSNGSATYWAADDQGVTSVAAGTGLSGGTITSTGTLSVNASYIATISANNASYLGTVAAASYARLDASGTFASRMTATANQTSSMLTTTASLGGFELQSANSTSAAFMCFHRPAAYASYFGIDTDNNFAVGGWSAGAGLGLMKVGSFGVGTAASGTAGEIRATNNITAYYSDKRLKTDIRQIEDALDKVNKISGVTFVSNEEAAKYGYTNKKTQVGVIAQEIEAVLPEVVVPAPFDIAKADDGTEYSKSGQNYKTVQYEKLVPLLIEAIKELTSKVQTLEEQIEVLKK